MNPGMQQQLRPPFQPNLSATVSNFSPPIIECPPPTFQNRPPFPHFGDPRPRAVSESMNSPPFKFMGSNVPPPRQEVPRFAFPNNVNAPSFRPMIDRPPPCRQNFPMFPSAGENNHFSPRPDYRHPLPRAVNPQVRPLFRESVPHLHPNVSSVQMEPRFSAPFARAPFQHRFPPRNRSPSFTRQSSSYGMRGRSGVPPKRKNTVPFNNTNKKFKERDGRKIKEASDDKVAKPFYCDTCDRAFALENELSEHLAEHTRCNAGGCNFEAHPKIVALHKKMQHDTGYAAAINKLQSAEEIQKWRAERKRRFPTAENIQKKKAEQAEKEARGEVLETKEFGKFKRQNFERSNVRGGRFHRGGRRGRNYFNKGRSRRNFTNFSKLLDSDTDSDTDSHIHLKKFSGMSSLLSNSTDDGKNALSDNSVGEENASLLVKQDVISQDESVEIPYNLGDSPVRKGLKDCRSSLNSGHEKSSEIQIIDTDNEPEICITSIKRLSSGFESDPIQIEGSDDDSPIEIPIIKEKANGIVVSTGSLNGESYLPENDAHNEQPQNMEDMALKQSSCNSSKNSLGKVNNQRVRKSYEKQYDDPNNERNNFHRKSSLLEKLLADEIRHERNVILQCVHYIVRKNYFGIGNQKIKSDFLLS
ncbi:FMR1-interacting protein NUFIP1-like [Uloborus diversus]|uniref:FMR1-interacting protein NUFIP1-like n=1 Tax=Uloborus diversus TaxID=327109 RepID=UPI0024097459|nr:FMR1-interacting protein NUFIP1-like [Uloborus diversus]